MKFSQLRVLFVVGFAVFIAAPGFAQMHEKDSLISFSPLGPLLGIYELGYEKALNAGGSIEVGVNYFNAKAGLLGALVNAAGIENKDYDVWSLLGRVGSNYYVSGTAPEGAFVGATVEAGYLYARGGDFVVDGTVLGAYAKVGYRVFFGGIALAPYVGVGYVYTWFGGDVSELDLEESFGRKFYFPWSIQLSIAF